MGTLRREELRRVPEHSLRLSIRRNVKYGEGIPEQRARRNQTIKYCRFIWTKEQIRKPLVFGHNLAQMRTGSFGPPTSVLMINLHPPGGKRLCPLLVTGSNSHVPFENPGRKPQAKIRGPSVLLSSSLCLTDWETRGP